MQQNIPFPVDDHDFQENKNDEASKGLQEQCCSCQDAVTHEDTCGAAVPSQCHAGSITTDKAGLDDIKMNKKLTAVASMESYDHTPIKKSDFEQVLPGRGSSKIAAETSVWQYFDSIIEENDSSSEWSKREPRTTFDPVISGLCTIALADELSENSAVPDLSSNSTSHNATSGSTCENISGDVCSNAVEPLEPDAFLFNRLDHGHQIDEATSDDLSSRIELSLKEKSHTIIAVESSESINMTELESNSTITKDIPPQTFPKDDESCLVSSYLMHSIPEKAKKYDQMDSHVDLLGCKSLPLQRGKEVIELDSSENIHSMIDQGLSKNALTSPLLNDELRNDNTVSSNENVIISTEYSILGSNTQHIPIETGELLSCQEQKENYDEVSPCFEYKNVESKNGITENFIESSIPANSTFQPLPNSPIAPQSNILKGPVSLDSISQPFKNVNFTFTIEKKKLHEDETSREWYDHKLHVFIFTFSGKPVFTRYGKEESLSAFTGTLAAILTTMQSLFCQTEEEDSLRCISLRGHCFAFLQRGPLWLAAIASSGETLAQLQRLLNGVHLQIISLLTHSIEKALISKPSYDVRQLLGGTDSVICNFISWFSKDMFSVVDGFEPLPISPSTRAIANSILKNVGSPNIFAAILVAHHRVVAISVSKSIKLSASDIALLLNLVASSASLRQAESWTPVCLPGVDNRAFLYAYVNFLTPDTIGFIGLTSNSDGEQFYAFSDHFKKVAALLSNTNCLQEVYKSLHYSPYQLSTPLWEQLEIIHLLYYSPPLQQYFSSRFSRNYGDKMHCKHIIRMYGRCNILLNDQKAPAHAYLNAK
ncbi:trafficking protein mon1 subfamily protein, partial [Cardiosporidium cionae]